MKPYLYERNGWWYCGRSRAGTGVSCLTGSGSTAVQAYQNWKVFFKTLEVIEVFVPGVQDRTMKVGRVRRGLR